MIIIIKIKVHRKIFDKIYFPEIMQILIIFDISVNPFFNSHYNQCKKNPRERMVGRTFFYRKEKCYVNTKNIKRTFLINIDSKNLFLVKNIFSTQNLNINVKIFSFDNFYSDEKLIKRKRFRGVCALFKLLNLSCIDSPDHSD